MQYLPNAEVVITDPALYEDLGNSPLMYATEGSAAVDLRSDRDFVLYPGEQITVESGLRIWLKDPNYVGLVYARSGTGTKGLVLGNHTGVIDSDYQGQLYICLYNRHVPVHEHEYSDSDAYEAALEKVTWRVKRGDRVAQYLVTPVVHPNFTVVQEFSNATKRGEGGFGSTGK